MSNPFYIGYYPKMDRSNARWIALSAGILLLAFLGAAWMWLPIMQDAGDGQYDYGEVRSWSGLVLNDAYPILSVLDEDNNPREVLLVVPFKKGADEFVSGRQGQMIEVIGTRIERGGIMMIELDGSPVHQHASESVPEASRTIDGVAVTASGEIVDSKCWLGVMNPGEGSVHRACANLCIRGGIPPAFRYREADGTQQTALLYGPNGEHASSALHDLAGRLISLSGTYTRSQSGSLPRFVLNEWPSN